MKFKSIQTMVVVFAGAALFTVVAALVVQVLMSGHHTQALVQQRSEKLLGELIEERLMALVVAQADIIQNDLEDPMLLSSNLAQINALLDVAGADGKPVLALSREEIIQILRTTLVNNPKFYAIYVGWEPDAFNSSDARYADQPGHNAVGRFMPWLYRTESGIELSYNVEMESEELLPTGDRAGEYYLWPRQHKRSFVVGLVSTSRWTLFRNCCKRLTVACMTVLATWP
jgi:methyl-accepting chemotaxis protein